MDTAQILKERDALLESAKGWKQLVEEIKKDRDELESINQELLSALKEAQRSLKVIGQFNSKVDTTISKAETK